MPIDEQAETFVLRTFERILMFSGEERTSTFAPACAIKLSHCNKMSDRISRSARWTDGEIRRFHQLGDELLLLRLVRLRGNHVSDGLVERMNLKRR